MKKPMNCKYYNPQETPIQYPLELTEELHICLWDKEGKYKWTIAYWVEDSEGYDLKFVGDRPFDKRVKWKPFRQLVKQGQKIANKQWKKNEKEDW